MHPIGSHALLADGRTAALVAPDGEVAWLCWPRFDSAPCLLGVLDATLGGGLAVAPVAPGARTVSRRYLDGTLVLRTVWETVDARLTVDDTLRWDGPPALLRVLRAEGGAVGARATWTPAPDAGRARARWALYGHRAVAAWDGTSVAVDGNADWHGDGDGVACTMTVEPGRPCAVVLHDALSPAMDGADAATALEDTARRWRALDRRLRVDLVPGGVAARTLGEARADALLRLAGRVIVGLRHRSGGVVAAPTTSIPQWPGSTRTWDYRYAWPRDTALAAMALLRLGLDDEAEALGGFCGAVCASGEPPSLVRVDGAPPPPEAVLPHLAGHGDARPVRVGNAAAGQAQLDVLGEVVDLAHALHRAGRLPAALRAAVPRLAGTAARRAWDPDHGIWEVRGAPRRYTQSRVMAWTALRRAASLARSGAVAGGAEPWDAAAAALRDRTLAHCVDSTGALTLHDGGGGADASLSLVPLVGFLDPGDRRVAATLDLIVGRLRRGGLLDRYEGSPDGIADPCAPFVFATFWTAAALERCGRDGAPLFAAAAAARGDLDLMGEVAHPDGAVPFGNLPQVQSHAALVLAATTPRRAH